MSMQGRIIVQLCAAYCVYEGKCHLKDMSFLIYVLRRRCQLRDMSPKGGSVDNGGIVSMEGSVTDRICHL